jgi:hypothetical protein
MSIYNDKCVISVWNPWASSGWNVLLSKPVYSFDRDSSKNIQPAAWSNGCIVRVTPSSQIEPRSRAVPGVTWPTHLWSGYEQVDFNFGVIFF